MHEPTIDHQRHDLTADHSTDDPNATAGHESQPPDTPPRASAAAAVPDGYGLLEAVGRGGMGVVYRARDVALGRDVAVKFLRHPTPSGADRFLAEARITARLQHPGIPPVHQVGTLPDGSPFLAMKLVRGKTLAELLAARPSAADDSARFLAAFEQVCQAVGYAHSEGVTHRDLKPANVMVGAFGEIQVMDWGLARAKGEGRRMKDESEAGEPRSDSAFQTAAGSVFGTPAYMPPEQARGEWDRVDARADVFALGGTLCEILTGQPPYAGPALSDVLFAAANAKLDDAFSRLDASGADAELVALAKRCLSPEPGGRPADGAAVADAVAAHRTGVAERLRKAEEERAVAAAEAREQRKRRRVQLVLAGFAILVVAAAGWAVSWYQADRHARRAEEAARNLDRERKEQHVRSDVTAGIAEADARLAECPGLVDNPVRWDAVLASARAAADRADGVLKSGGEVEDLLVAVNAARVRLAAAARDRKFVARLEELAASFPDTEGRRRFDADFAAAFRDAGIDPDALSPAEFAERVVASPVGEVVAISLFFWDDAEDLPPGRKERLDAAARAAKGAYSWPEVNTAGRAAAFAGTLDAAAVLPRRVQLLAEFANRVDRPAGLRILNAGVTQYPNDFLLQTITGLWHLGGGTPRYESALPHFQAAVAVRPLSSAARSNLSVVLLELKNPEQAVAEARLATRFDPANHLGFASLGNALREVGDFAGSAEAYRRTLALRPDYAKAHYGLAVTLEKAGDATGALARYRQAAALDPRLAEAHHNAGALLQEVGDLRAAAGYLRTAHALRPAARDTLVMLGNVLDRLGDHETAGGLLLKAVGLYPDSTDACAVFAINRLNSARFAEAVAGFDSALRLPPSEQFPRPMLENTRALAANMLVLDRRLSVVLDGDGKPADPDEAIQLALLCYRMKGMYATGVRFFDTWATGTPAALSDVSGLRYEAGKAALLAGFGRGPDAPPPGEWAALRKTALRYLTGELNTWGIHSQVRPDRAPAAHAALSRWTSDPHLAFTRSAFGRLAFPPDERDDWARFWQSLQNVLDRTAAKK